MTLFRRISLSSLLFSMAVAYPSGAAESQKIDLERTKPVPGNETIPIADFFRPGAVVYPQLSRDGKHIAAMFSAGEDSYGLLVYELQTQKTETLGASADRDIGDFFWMGNQRLGFLAAARKIYSLGLLGADVGPLTKPYPLMQGADARLVSVPRNDPTHPLIWIRSDIESGKDMGVVRLNSDLHTGEVINWASAGYSGADYAAMREGSDRHILASFTALTEGIGTGYMADKDGNLAFGTRMIDGVTNVFRFEGGNWIKCAIDTEAIEVLSPGEKPNELVVLGPRQEGKPRQLQFLDAATGKLGDPLMQDKGYDVQGWFYRDPATQRIVGVHYERNGPSTVWFLDGYVAVQKTLESMFPKLVVAVLGYSDDLSVFLLQTYSDRQPPVYHWANLANKTAGRFKSAMPWIDPDRMQPMNIFKFKTLDGHQLDAYLTLPAGTSKSNKAPMVVLPHGGPWARDTWGFNGEVQFLASRGYAVLQPNYRGSTGSNWMFPEEDEWAFRKMHDDVTSATKAALGTGLIDSNRVAIMGSSFGAYLALCGVAYEPNLYQCGVGIAGVYDWGQVIREHRYDKFDNPNYSRLVRKLGDPSTQKEKFDAISPARHIDQVKVPVFISHGGDDPVADINESRHLVSQLDKYKVPHETYFVSEETHGMANLKHQVELYSRIEVFLAKYLHPMVPAPAAPAGTP